MLSWWDQAQQEGKGHRKLRSFLLGRLWEGLMSNRAGTKEGTDCVNEPGKGGRISPFPWQQATRSAQLAPPQKHSAPPGSDQAALGLGCHPFSSDDLSLCWLPSPAQQHEVLIPRTGPDWVYWSKL